METEELTSLADSNESSGKLAIGVISLILGIISLVAFCGTFIGFFVASTFHEFGLQALIIFYVLILTSILGLIFGRKTQDYKQGKIGSALNLIALIVNLILASVFTFFVFLFTI